MAKFSVDGEEDEDVPSTSVLGRRRRFPSSAHQSEEEEEASRRLPQRRRRYRPAEEEEGGREEEEDWDSDSDRREELDRGDEEFEGKGRDRSMSTNLYGDEHSQGRSWSPPYGRTVGSLEVTLTDPDVFDCSVCLEPLTSPVYQCDNGHIACSSCCGKISNKCPSCSMPIGYNRCRAMEKVLESVQMACRNVKFGCNQKFGYHMKSDHENTCPFTPCLCPFSSCNFIGSFRILVKHISTKHGASPTSFHFNFNTFLSVNIETEVRLLKEEREDVLFVLKNETVELGSKIKISCIGPLPKAAYSYDIVANCRESSLKLHGCTKSVSDFECNPNVEPYLLVPRGLFDDGLRLEVCIGRRGGAID